MLIHLAATGMLNAASKPVLGDIRPTRINLVWLYLIRVVTIRVFCFVYFLLLQILNVFIEPGTEPES